MRLESISKKNIYSYKNDSLDILRYLACYLRDNDYKNKDIKENLVLIEAGLVHYSLLKLYSYNTNIADLNSENVTNLKGISKQISNRIAAGDCEDYFFQYINCITYLLGALNDNSEIRLEMVEGEKITITKKDTTIKSISIGKDIKPEDRAVRLLNCVKSMYTQEKSLKK